LEQIYGIGPKTSRFFILWTRPNASFAALDRHILRWLREKGYQVSKTPPTGKRYCELENIFLEEARQLNKSARQLDSEIWSTASGFIVGGEQ
jgi:thermostable 8-oxoguanine DNA glycosylase